MSDIFHYLKNRIKSILRYKNPGLWVIALSIIIVAAVGIGLAADPKANMLNEPGGSVVIYETDERDEKNEQDGQDESKGGKHITFLYSANGELFAIMTRKLFDINIENGWRVSGDMNNKDFMCYSLKDKYSTDETLTINAVLINNNTNMKKR